MKKSLTLLILLCVTIVAMADTDRQYIRSGNRLYHQQKYDKAEVEYRKAVDQNKENPQALYNLGCALLAQQKDSAAVEQFEIAGKRETNKMRKARIYHNIGWVCQSKKMYGEAIEAYKESLRNNPNDEETRYNLALCQRQKQKQDQQQQQQQKDEPQQDPNQQEERPQEQEQEQDKPADLDKDNAERLLNAAMQKEKETQDKLKNMQQPEQRSLQNNW